METMGVAGCGLYRQLWPLGIGSNQHCTLMTGGGGKRKGGAGGFGVARCDGTYGDAGGWEALAQRKVARAEALGDGRLWHDVRQRRVWRRRWMAADADINVNISGL